MKRVTITLPEEQARAIEAVRRKKRLPRSRIIQHAIARYLAEEGLVAAVREYEEGYRRIPEDVAEAESFGAAASEVLSPEDWE
jgi:metal-responsive CopG/Arc/MetJ family transcriptional regulator